MHAQPEVSVVVVNWNTRELLRECLASVVAQMAEVDLGLLVVDNASTDGSADMVGSEFPRARLWVNPENRGFAAANNQALAEARGRIAFLLNSDAYLKPGALRALVDYMDAHPEDAVVGMRVLNPDGTTQPSCFRFPTLWDVFCEMSFLTTLFPQSPLFNRRGMGGFDRRTLREVDWVLGAAMAVRREWTHPGGRWKGGLLPRGGGGAPWRGQQGPGAGHDPAARLRQPLPLLRTVPRERVCPRDPWAHAGGPAPQDGRDRAAGMACPCARAT